MELDEKVMQQLRSAPFHTNHPDIPKLYEFPQPGCHPSGCLSWGPVASSNQNMGYPKNVMVSSSVITKNQMALEGTKNCMFKLRNFYVIFAHLERNLNVI